MSEVWKPVINYEGLYEVSNLGNVNALANDKEKKEKILKPGVNSRGYLNVSLTKNKKATSMVVHRIVGLSFLEWVDGCTQINHIDGDKKNNTVTNLEWVSASENIWHAVKTELRVSLAGCEHGRAKFKTDDIICIRNTYASGKYSIEALSKKHNVSARAMHDIVRRKSYTHV